MFEIFGVFFVRHFDFVVRSRDERWMMRSILRGYKDVYLRVVGVLITRCYILYPAGKLVSLVKLIMIRWLSLP